MAPYSIALRERLSRKERLRCRRDFERVYRLGKRVRLPYLTLIFAPNELGVRRMGLSVSKRKVGKAVYRNRAKRILREVFRRHKDLFPKDHDIVFVPHKGVLERSVTQIVEDLGRVLRKK